LFFLDHISIQYEKYYVYVLYKISEKNCRNLFYNPEIFLSYINLVHLSYVEIFVSFLVLAVLIIGLVFSLINLSHILSLQITIVIPLILGAVLFYVSLFFYHRKDNEYPPENANVDKIPLGKNVTSGFLAVAIGTAFIIPTMSLVTSYLEEVPEISNTKSWGNGSMYVNIKYPNPLNVPVKNSLESKNKTIIVELYHPDTANIRFVNLISPDVSPLSTDGNFTNMTKKLIKTQLVNVSGILTEKLYNAQTKVVHNGDISNKTYKYNLVVGYTDGAGKAVGIKEITIPFNWTVITKDLSWINYLWIVMAGVVTSRFITFIADTKKTESIDIDRTESIWIAFTFIIAILAFSSFKDNVTLGQIVLFNVLISFAFGFGSQKVLELARAFPASTQIPAQVKGLKLTPGPTQIKLEWDQNPENDIDHYNIYMGKSENFVILAQAPSHTSPPTETSYTDKGLDPNTTYYYRVSAVNKAGSIGPHSSEQSAITP